MKTTSHHVQFQPGGKYYPIKQCTFQADFDMGSTMELHPKVIVWCGSQKHEAQIRSIIFKSDQADAAKAEAERIIEEALGLFSAENHPERVVLNREDSTRFAEALLKAGPFPIEPLPGPALRVTPDGHVIQFGAITAPDGCYLLAAGEVLQEGDLSFCWQDWFDVNLGEEVEAHNQYTYARKLPEKGGQ